MITPLYTAYVGKQHTNADALSRGRCVQCGLEKKEEEREEANSCDAVSHLMLPTCMDGRGDKVFSEC